MKRKIEKKLVQILFLAVILFLWPGISTAQEAKLIKVPFSFDWMPYYPYAPFVLGIEKGYYTQEGLELEIIPTKSGAISGSMVANNKASFGCITGPGLMSAKEKGLPLKALLSFMPVTAHSVMFWKKSGIKEPADLAGKTIVCDFTSTRRLLLNSFLKKFNLLDKVTIAPGAGGPEAEAKIFLSGKADAMFMSFFWLKSRMEDSKWDKIGVFKLSDYGIRMVHSAFVTNEETIKEKPWLVKKFTRATIKSWEYALAHQGEAIDALMRRYPLLNQKIESKGFAGAASFAANPYVKNKSFGYMSSQEWKETLKVLIETGQLKKMIDVKNLYTNDFR